MSGIKAVFLGWRPTPRSRGGELTAQDIKVIKDLSTRYTVALIVTVPRGRLREQRELLQKQGLYSQFHKVYIAERANSAYAKALGDLDLYGDQVVVIDWHSGGIRWGNVADAVTVLVQPDTSVTLSSRSALDQPTHLVSQLEQVLNFL